MGRKNEAGFTLAGAITGAIAGAKIGAHIGIVTGGIGMAATVPLGIIGGAIVGLTGNKIGSEIDRHK